VYYRYDPESSILFPKCPVRLLLGIPCPGCGSQRAIHSLLNLNFAKALEYNAFLTLVLPLIAIMATASLFREKCPSFYKITHHKYVAISFAILILLWWLLRIIFHWYV